MIELHVVLAVDDWPQDRRNEYAAEVLEGLAARVRRVGLPVDGTMALGTDVDGRTPEFTAARGMCTITRRA